MVGEVADAGGGTAAGPRSWLTDVTKLVDAIHLDANGNLPTAAFLRAAKRFPDIFEILFGEGRVSAQLRADVEGNVDSLQAIYDHDPDAFPTLNLAPVTGPGGVEGQVKLLWLQRGLFWLYKLVQEVLARPDETVSTVAWSSYENTLGKHHNWLVRKFAGVAMGVAPDRPDLLVSLGARTCGGGCRPVFRSVRVHFALVRMPCCRLPVCVPCSCASHVNAHVKCACQCVVPPWQKAFGLTEEQFQEQGQEFVLKFTPIIVLLNRKLVAMKLEVE